MEVEVLSEIFPRLRAQFDVVSIPKGKVFFLNYLYPHNSSNYFRIEIKPNNGKRLIAKEDLILVVNNLHPSRIGARELKFVRAERKEFSREKLVFGEVTTNTILRKILKSSTLERYHSLGGFQNSVIYPDETIITDEGSYSDTGWILTKNDISAYIPDEKQFVSIYVEHTIKGVARIISEQDAFEKLQDMKLPNSKVVGVFKITYSTISKETTEIINLKNNQKSVKIIMCSKYPQRYASLGSKISINNT